MWIALTTPALALGLLTFMPWLERWADDSGAARQSSPWTNRKTPRRRSTTPG
jgi:hypothetical protein